MSPIKIKYLKEFFYVTLNIAVIIKNVYVNYKIIVKGIPEHYKFQTIKYFIIRLIRHSTMIIKFKIPSNLMLLDFCTQCSAVTCLITPQCIVFPAICWVGSYQGGFCVAKVNR